MEFTSGTLSNSPVPIPGTQDAGISAPTSVPYAGPAYHQLTANDASYYPLAYVDGTQVVSTDDHHYYVNSETRAATNAISEIYADPLVYDARMFGLVQQDAPAQCISGQYATPLNDGDAAEVMQGQTNLVNNAPPSEEKIPMSPDNNTSMDSGLDSPDVSF